MKNISKNRHAVHSFERGQSEIGGIQLLRLNLVELRGHQNANLCEQGGDHVYANVGI